MHRKEKQVRWKESVLFLSVLFCFLVLCANGFAQEKKVSFSCKEMLLSEALTQIERQSEYKLNFNYDELNQFKVTVNIEKESIQNAILTLLKGLPYQMKVNGRFIIISRRVVQRQQSRSLQRKGSELTIIRGKVVDASDNPLPGVNVSFKDRNYGATTDANGNYAISVEKGGRETMLFSFIGMKTEVVPITCSEYEKTLDITMKENSSQLNEVVVTGYQSIQKPKMTGSVVTISSDKLMERYTSNLLSNLEGQVAGLSTYGGELKVRGTSSLYAETSPLLVVDGLPIEGRLEDLNQYDIQSINVLKDAAATAIYGARASNGVIVITTKNANQRGKIDVAFNVNLTLKENPIMDYKSNFYMDAAQQVAKESEYYDYYFFSGAITDPVGSTLSGYNFGNGPVSPLNYAYYRAAKGEITMDELGKIKTQLSHNNYAKEYADAVYKQQVLQEYNLSLRSRSEKSQNNVTLNYQYDNAGIINTMYQRFTANYKGSFDVTKWMTANLSINSVYNKSRERGYDATSNANNVWTHSAYESLYDANGNIRKMYGVSEGNELWQGGGYGTLDLASNPIDEFYNNTETTSRLHMRYHADLQFRIWDGLTANVQGIYEYDQNTNEWLATEDSHPARVIKNAYCNYDPSTGTMSYMTPETGGFRRTRNTNGLYWTTRGQLNYSKTFGKHEVNTLAGLEFRQTKYKGSNSLLLGYDDQLQTGSAVTVNFLDLYNQQYSPYYKSNLNPYDARNYAFIPYIQNSMDNIKEVMHRFASGYANLTYTYDSRYNAFASFRKDYSDVYGLNAKYRGKPLWSVGVAWNMEQEDFLKNVKPINYLKLRYSYGVTGNIYQGATSYMTATTGSLNSYTKLPLATIDSPANPNLRWEQTRTSNLGVDFSLMTNRIRGSIDYYHKVAKDVFSNKSLDPTSGFTSMFVNTADMSNNGIEVQVTADWLRPGTRKAFGWSTSYTLAHNSNKVTNVENPSMYAYQLLTNRFVKGYPASALWSYKFAGIDDGKISGPGETLWYGEGGTISHSVQNASTDVMEYSGQTDPKVIMGMDNRFEWNGISLSVMMVYYGGHVMRCLQETEYGQGSIAGALPSYLVNSWTPQHPTSTPGFGQYGSTSIGNESYYGNNSIYNASFLKIRNIVLGYEFPKEMLHHLSLNRLAFNIQVDNPKALWTANKKGIDPETLGVRTRSNYIFSIFVNY